MAVAPSPKQKTFLYKKAALSKETGDGAKTLEVLLKEALAATKKAVDRMERPEGSVEVQFINYHLTHTVDQEKTIFGCEFLGYEVGADQSMIKLDADADQIDVEAIPAGEDREFLAGSVYFAVKGNHVILFQSRGLKTQHLESYLNWLLRVKTKTLADDNPLRLDDHVSADKKEAIKGAKGIKLTAPVMMTTDTTGTQNGVAPVVSGKKIRVKPTGRGWEAFKALLGDDLKIPRLTVEDLAKVPSLRIELSLRWSGKHDENSGDFLDSVASQMRHVDDEVDFTVNAESGDFGREKFKVFKDVSVPWTDTGRPKFDVLYRKMGEVLAQFLKDGSVDP
jgi:hypothetical protein